jgi:hypothetical protein
MQHKNLFIAFIVLLALASILPLFNISLPFGNPNLGTTPVTLAAVYLPWYMALITGLTKGISAAAFTGRWLVELSAGIGDTLMACFTFWLARSMHKTIAAILGQLSRYVFTSGLVALTISTALASGMINPSQSPVSGLTGTFLHDLVMSWSGISYPSITVSILFNFVVSVLVIMIFGRPIEQFLSAGKKAENKQTAAS